jgi:hypothetical protein
MGEDDEYYVAAVGWNDRKSFMLAEQSDQRKAGAKRYEQRMCVVPMHEKTDITSRRYIAEDRVTFRAVPEVAAGELARTADEVRHALTDVG